MPHDLLAAPFLGRYLLLRPGSTEGVQLPRGYFDQLAQAAAAGGSYPPWLAGLARQRWGVNLPGHRGDARAGAGPRGVRVRVRAGELGDQSRLQLCLLALLPGPEGVRRAPVAGKARLLHMMRDAGVVWLQITGGEPTIDKHFPDAYRLAFELGMMLTISTNGSRLWRPDLLELFTSAAAVPAGDQPVRGHRGGL